MEDLFDDETIKKLAKEGSIPAATIKEAKQLLVTSMEQGVGALVLYEYEGNYMLSYNLEPGHDPMIDAMVTIANTPALIGLIGDLGEILDDPTMITALSEALVLVTANEESNTVH